ncbi:class I SAM-dependent methyltransferase [Frisingicoccus sp.]|uniref:class I SAM-dependent methyltransferase n=1 Tax=Frisingicoccus sp. TaxID=1918627 RepID=UPI003AB1B961
MEEKKDIGLSYLRQLEMNPPKESKALYFQFSAKYGETIGRKMLSDIYRKIREYEQNPNYLAEFYEMKNELLDKALLFNGGYQADNYRQMCNWIVENHDVFGKEILDAGCECGIMSCFLGMAFPESHITAVDRSPNAIKAAKELAARLDVHNITFINADVTNLPGQKYDTVFAMRLLQENCAIDHVMSSYNLLKAEAAEFAENIHPFAKKLTALVAEEGYLVSAERCDVDPVFLGWMQKLNEFGLAGVPECHKELVCKEMENEGRIQVYVARNCGMEEADEVYRFWCACQIVHTELTQHSQYTGWYADMELQNFSKDLLDGFIIQDTEGNNLLTYSLWTHKEFPDIVLVYQAMGDEHILSLFQASTKDDIIRQIEAMKDEYVQAGTVAKKLVYENGSLCIA